MAENSPGREKHTWLQKAFDSETEAVRHFPGSARLNLDLAGIAEQLDRKQAAVEHYEKAVHIEDSYRQQFTEMYPGRKLFSRLGEEKYLLAKERIKQISRD